MRVALREIVGGQQLRNTRSADTDRAVGTPSRFKREGTPPQIGFGRLHAEPVEEIDKVPVARVPGAVATIVGPQRTDTSLVVVPKGLSSDLAPGLIAEPYAL